MCFLLARARRNEFGGSSDTLHVPESGPCGSGKGRIGDQGTRAASAQ